MMESGKTEDVTLEWALERIERLQAENAKLRESLETIADSLSCTGEDAVWMIEEARQALAAQEE